MIVLLNERRGAWRLRNTFAESYHDEDDEVNPARALQTYGVAVHSSAAALKKHPAQVMAGHWH
jgi:hypothetical protein